MAVKLLTDSATDISAEEAEELGITMFPMTITFGEEEYLDGVNLFPQDFYNKLASNKELPKTSQVNEYTFEGAFERLTANGDEVVAITISSRLSGTYNGACNAAEKFNGKVYVIDSLSATVGERHLCTCALELIKAGKSAKEIAMALEEAKKKLKVFAMIDTLKYLKLGGRLSGAEAVLGTLLSIKPVVEIIDGEVKNIGKVMGFNKAIGFLNDKIKELGVDYDMPHAYIFSGNDETNIKKYMSASSHLFEEGTPAYCLGGTIGTHIGPGAVGVAFFAK